MGGSKEEGVKKVNTYECSDQQFVNHIKSVKEEITKGGFAPLPRGIHAAKAIQFYSTILGASQDVIQLLEGGYKPEFINGIPPPSNQFPNNRSAAHKMSFVRQQVEKWENQGFIQRCVEKPYLVSPLSVSVKFDPITGKEKPRVCLDLSQGFNDYLVEHSCKLEDLSLVLPR